MTRSLNIRTLAISLSLWGCVAWSLPAASPSATRTRTTTVRPAPRSEPEEPAELSEELWRPEDSGTATTRSRPAPRSSPRTAAQENRTARAVGSGVKSGAVRRTQAVESPIPPSKILPEPAPRGRSHAAGHAAGRYSLESVFEEGAFDPFVEGHPMDGYPMDGNPMDGYPMGGGYGHPFCAPFASRLWVQGEYLHWWVKNGETPPLITTSPAGTAVANAGRLDQANTSVVVGGDDLADDDRSGARVTLGYWWTPCLAVEANWFTLGDTTESRSQTSQGAPILARPFFNTQTDTADAALIAFPNQATGFYQIDYSSQIQGGEALLRKVLFQTCNGRWDLLLGYKTMELDEELVVLDNVLGGPGAAAPNSRVIQRDVFATDNEFHGFELGIAGTQQCGCVNLAGVMKLALGNSQTIVNISGSTQNTDANNTVTNGNVGFLAVASNIGRFEDNEFTVMPELGLSLAYDFSPCLRANVGYTLIYWGHVARPGDQIDLDINPNQFFPPVAGGAARPESRLVTDSFWAQGLNVGLTYQF